MAILFLVALYLLCDGFAAVSALPPRALKEVIVASNLTAEQLSRVAFKYKFVNHVGDIFVNNPGEPSIKVAATVRVTEDAHYKAALIVSRMLRNTPVNVFNSISKSDGVGIFSRFESVAAFPQFAHLADKPGCTNDGESRLNIVMGDDSCCCDGADRCGSGRFCCTSDMDTLRQALPMLLAADAVFCAYRCDGYCRSTCSGDGRKFSKLGGLASRIAVVLEDIVTCSKNDPYGHQENILVHEFAHTIRIFLPKELARRADAAYAEAKSLRLWTKGNYPYAMSNFQEFWAGATESFFMTTTRLDFTGGMNMCGTNNACPDERAARSYIRRHQPNLFHVLNEVYTGNRANIKSGLRVCM